MNITAISEGTCTSCQLCAAVCPKQALSIRLDDDGFYRPVLAKDLCVDCGICTNVCYKFDNDIKMTDEESLQQKPLYAAWAKDDGILLSSTSGGIGSLLAQKLIEEGYKVVGCAYNYQKSRAEHREATHQEELLQFRGSKYIQSYTFDALLEIVRNSKDQKYAVFGTACQVYALHKYAVAHIVRDHFFFVDFYCHGCPSMHVWTKYKNYIKQKLDIERFDQVVFRSKRKGWGTYNVDIFAKGKKVFESNPREDGFYELFFSDLVLNDGCHTCKLRSTLEYTDIRFGDFWGKKYLTNRKGVSGVSISTHKGMEIYRKIETEIESSSVGYKEFLPYQSWHKEYSPNIAARAEILASLRDNKQTITDALAVFRRHQSIKGKIKRIVKHVLYYLPYSFTIFLKRL